jgi:dipeptidyl aminopeptidase/acylaminoacyl peptidase
MDAGGSSVTQVTRSPGWYGGPLWSPDGQTIAFSLRRVDTGKWTVGIIGALGGDPRLLTNSSGNDILDAWSPDGHRLLFHSDRDGANQLYAMAADGTGQTRLTTGGDNWGGSWSPDAQAIAFTSGRTGRLQLYVMNADGTSQRRLVRSAANDWLPAWSPDGTRLAFDSDRDGSTQVYVANQDGSGQANVLRSSSVQLSGWTPRWSPDGRRILYASSGNPPAGTTPFVRQALGAAAIIVQAALLMGILLLGLRGGTLPVGSVTLILAVNALLVSVLQDQYRLIPAAIVAGVAGDLVLWRLHPSLTRPRALRLFAFLLPAVFYACYFATLQLSGGIGWSIHLWLGTTVVAGIVGLLLSFLVVPPASFADRWVPAT